MGLWSVRLCALAFLLGATWGRYAAPDVDVVPDTTGHSGGAHGAPAKERSGASGSPRATEPAAFAVTAATPRDRFGQPRRSSRRRGFGAEPRLANAAQPRFGNWGQRELPYDGQVTFVRLRWRTGSFGTLRPPFGGVNFWMHEFPRAEQNLMTTLRQVTEINGRTDGSLILTLDDARLFRYPIAVMWEPGYWMMTDREAGRLREYLLKGGFVIFNDFELDQWDNFEAQMRRVMPGGRWIKMNPSHPVFGSLFTLERIDFPHPPNHHLFGFRPEYFGLFEDNDPNGRLLAIANYNTNLAEYWQMAGTGFFPIDSGNEAFKLGINYFLYALTH